MRKRFWLVLLVLVMLCGCSTTPSDANQGSFTSEKAFSYDNNYYAVQTIVEKDDISYINVEIFTAGDVPVASFQPARASDFWSICWEKDTYNIWIQSGDLGTLCYSCENEVWTRNTSAVRPDYIVSKYDS